MCGILDANAAGDVFGSNSTAAGDMFFDWINSGGGCLVVGGMLWDELITNGNFLEWASDAERAGRLRRESDSAVSARTDDLKAQGACRSNDEHIIALAQVGGVRLLYTDDRQLTDDFLDRDLISNPRGRVYPHRGTSSNAVRRRREVLRTTVCVRGSRGSG